MTTSGCALFCTILPNITCILLLDVFNKRSDLQGTFMEPFMHVLLQALRMTGYSDIAWRHVSSAAFGTPNPKSHIAVVASGPGVVRPMARDILFSTVRTLH